MSAIHAGDHLVSSRIGYHHHGIYEGLSSGEASCQVVCSSLDQFCQGKPFTVRSHPHRRLSREQSIARAYRRLGEHSYNLLFNNCEHFVQWCIEDEHDSPQVTKVATAVAAAELARLRTGHTARVAVSGLAGATVGSLGSSAATSTLLSLTAISSAPAWAPLAVGAVAAYGAHKLFKWLTD